MSLARARPGPPQRLLLSFAVLLLLPAAAVVWLGKQLVRLDHELEARQRRERLEGTADRVAATIEHSLWTTERLLASAPETLTARLNGDAVVVGVAGGAFQRLMAERLLYHPDGTLPIPVDSDAPVFAAPEVLEFVRLDFRGAVDALRELARSPSDGVRAGALLRLARNLRKLRRHDEALDTYRVLEGMRETRIIGLPADLVARRARCSLLRQIDRRQELDTEAAALRADLLASRWPLDRGTLTTYLQQVDSWIGPGQPPPAEREALAAAIGWLWSEHRAERLPAAGRRLVPSAEIDIVVIWQPRGDGLIALAAGPRFQEREWLRALQAPATAAVHRPEISAGIDTPDGHAPARDAFVVQRRPVETGLPWLLTVSGGGPGVETEEFASRRRMLLAGLSLLVFTIAAGGYVAGRALSREFAVARLQADFVSAVSHEFRTPLTSLHQFTTLLSDQDEPPADKRRTYYEAQMRGVERLRRLVESLLDFGRMEAGARPYRLEPLDAAVLVRRVVGDFERQAPAGGFTIECRAPADGPMIAADADALARAIWNLLENAAKYSGETPCIVVDVGRQEGRVSISVRDRGPGIPRDEQQAIFGKFVRGEASRRRGIKGTGIGLAMVRHIAEGHHGRVWVRSEPGQGSTFTIEIPEEQTR